MKRADPIIGTWNNRGDAIWRRIDARRGRAETRQAVVAAALVVIGAIAGFMIGALT